VKIEGIVPIQLGTLQIKRESVRVGVEEPDIPARGSAREDP
jgi:hypothetical protein